MPCHLLLHLVHIFIFLLFFCKRKPLTTPLSCRLSFSTTTTTDATFSFICLLFPSLLTQNVLFLCNMCLLSFGFVCSTFFRILYFCVILHGIMFVCWLLGVYGHAFNVLSFARNECCGTFLLRPSIRPWPTKRTTIMLLYAVTNWYPLCTCTSLEICHFVRSTQYSTFFCGNIRFPRILSLHCELCRTIVLCSRLHDNWWLTVECAFVFSILFWIFLLVCPLSILINSDFCFFVLQIIFKLIWILKFAGALGLYEWLTREWMDGASFAWIFASIADESNCEI